LGRDLHDMKINTEALLEVIMEVGLEVNTEEIKCMAMSLHRVPR